MEALEALRARIPGYAGYSDESARCLVDQQVRAWVGEQLALLDSRLRLSATDLAGAYDHLIRECEFADPRLMRALELREFDDASLGRLYAADLSLVDAANRAESIDMPSADAYLSELERLFARRGAMISADTEPQAASS